ncbi:Uncharacterised protein [Dorea longicatena]|nr:Uncharacterised protein [Dorea longicatena]
MKVLIGVRHVEISICGIYSYALYVRALDNNAEKDIYKRIKEYSEGTGVVWYNEWKVKE